MDYIYANLNDKVTKVTYEGVESSTAIVYVDQDKQTIKVDLKDHLGLTPDNVFSTQVPTINPTDPNPIKEDSFVLLAYVKDGVVTEYKYTSWKQVVEDDIVKRILSLEQSADKLDKLLNGEILVPKAVNSNTADKAKNGLPEPSIDKNIVTNLTGEWEAVKAYDVALELPDTITEITDYMFENNDIFSSVIIPSTVTVIGVGAFKNCTRLKEVIIKDGVRVISNSAFQGCNKLENVVISSTISSIGDNAFWTGNSNKIKVTVNSTIPAELSLSSFNPDTLDYIIVPMGYLDTYKTLWNIYAEFIYDTVPVSLEDIQKLTTILHGTDNIIVSPLEGGRNIEISGKNKSNATNLENGAGDVLIQTTDTNHSFKVMTDGRAKVQSAPTDNDDVVRKLELDKKLTAPVTPSAESAVTMLADGTVGTKLLSEIGGGGKLYKHNINLFLSVNSVSFKYNTVFYNRDNIAYTSIEDFYNKFKETSFLIILYSHTEVSGEVGGITSLKKVIESDKDSYKVSEGFTVGGTNAAYVSLNDSVLLSISDTVTEL